MAQRKSSAAKSDFLYYKGRPLVRCGDTLYYGNMYEKCVVMMQILSTKPYDDKEFADKVLVELILTDESVSPEKRILNKSEKQGLYNALDIASIWLERALSENGEDA